MTEWKFEVGALITNGSSAGRVLSYVDRSGQWGCPAYRIENIGLEQFNGNVGYTSEVPDYLATGWRRLPLEWAPVVGCSLEERYVHSGNGRMRRDLRPREVA